MGRSTGLERGCKPGGFHVRFEVLPELKDDPAVEIASDVQGDTAFLYSGSFHRIKIGCDSTEIACFESYRAARSYMTRNGLFRSLEQFWIIERCKC